MTAPQHAPETGDEQLRAQHALVVQQLETLRASEQEYRELFENAGDIIYLHDLCGAFISANTAALNTYGYSREELQALNISDIIDEAYLPLAREHIQSKISGATNRDRYELLSYTRQRAPVWVEVHTRIITGPHGPYAVQGIARDITRRRETEEALRQSQQRFKDTAELLPAIICEIGADRRITYVNQLGLRTFGYSAEDIERGLCIDEAVDPEELQRLLANFGAVFSGKLHGALEYRMKHKDGTLRYYTLNSAPLLREGRPVGLRTCLLDVHEEKLARENVRQSEERFRGIFNGSPIGIALCGADGACVEANDSFQKMFGLRGVCTGASLLELARLSPAQHKQAQGGQSLRFDTESAPSVRGAERCLQWHITPLGEKSGAWSGLLAQVQDVTEQRAAQRARLDEARRAADEARRLLFDMRHDMAQSHTCLNMVSRSPRMREVFDVLPQIADTPATVLVCGESGTGKELVARAIHDMSPRKDAAFVAINCSALPDTLLESELFGYKAGAFTDAKKDKPGRFAQADGGTLFLDEIGDISTAMQVKLLRVLQERVYEPLGATLPQKADVRVLAATNRDLPAMVKEGRFREDLYYRIKVLQVLLPPLRERLCDIPLLCQHFIERFNTRYGKQVRGVSQEALEILLAHRYPGNIREFENIIEHAFIFCKADQIEAAHLPADIRAAPPGDAHSVFAAVHSFEELEKLYIESVLSESGGSRLHAARRLGVHKATLFRKLKKFGIAATSGDTDEA